MSAFRALLRKGILQEMRSKKLTRLARKLASQSSNIGINPLRLLVRKRRQIIPVPLQRIGNLIRHLWRPELEDGVVVERPILGLLVLAPDLLALDTEDFHADAAGGGEVVG